MNISKLLSRRALSKLSPIGPDLGHNREALLALDKGLLHTAKERGLSSKIMPAYGNYIAKPAGAIGSLLYGRKMDGAKLLATLGGTVGLARYGGEAARPVYSYLNQIGKNIAGPEMAASKFFSTYSPDSVLNIVKPAVALTSKPLAHLDSMLGSTLHLAENPILASVALPFAAYGAVKGGGALLSRLGRARRLSQLQKGIAPRAYRQQARQLGYR